MKLGLLTGLLLLFLTSLRAEDQKVVSLTLEQKLQAYYQQLYSQNLSIVYEDCHPIGSKIGKATGVTVTVVKITQWKGGTPTGQADDVLQFIVDYTVLWKSPLHPKGGGHTEARSTYSVAEGTVTPIANTVLSTNARHITASELLKIHSAAKLAIFLVK